MNSSMYILLGLALVLANLPFMSSRFLGVIEVKHKHFVFHLCELAVGLVITGVLAYFLEQNMGMVHQQDWEFYVIVLCLYLVFAFPAFVLRYFWHGKNKE